MDFQGIIDFLDTATHPEVRHFRDGSHPGLGWWLKTICPNPYDPAKDTGGLGASWRRFAQRNPSLVRLMDRAFDWEGTVLTGTWSVWIADDHDVQVELCEGGLDLLPILKTTGDAIAAHTLQQADWVEHRAVRDAANTLMGTTIPDRRRRQFTVIEGDGDDRNPS